MRNAAKLAILASVLILPSCSTAPAFVNVEPDDKHEATLVDVGIPLAFREIVVREAAAEWIPLEVAANLFRFESRWDSRAVNENRDASGSVVSYDIGLGQLNSRYLDYFSREYNGGKRIDPLDPRENVRTSCRHLARLYRSTGTWEGAVSSYNCGLTRYRSGDPLPETTRRLTARVFGAKI